MSSEVTIGDDRLEMTRFFAYPRAAVFEAWTDPTQLVQWWGCRDTEHVDAALDLREGGKFNYAMRLKNGFEMEQQGVFVEVVAPERLVTRTKVGEGSEFEFSSTTTVTFTEENGGTRVTLVQVGLPPMPNACEIISTGTNDSFEKLERYLAR